MGNKKLNEIFTANAKLQKVVCKIIKTVSPTLQQEINNGEVLSTAFKN